MGTPKINENCHYVRNDPISVRLNLKNFIFISCAVLELLRKVSQGVESAPPGEIGLRLRATVSLFHKFDVSDSRQ